MRFSQILANFGFVEGCSVAYDESRVWYDEYNREPEHILARVMKTLESFNNLESDAKI